MNWIVANLWVIPVLPLLAAGAIALTKQPRRALAASLAIGSLGLAFFLSCAAFVRTLTQPGERFVNSVDWFVLGTTTFRLSWVLDPLTAAMLVMITLVGALIFIFSVGYMARDPNFTRFFCFLSLFAAAMLGLVIANNLLLLFMCWELVGLASYLLIGFWYEKPSASAAAKKAFITTRVGDIGFFLGLLWLYAETGTLLLYDGGGGCLEQSVKLAGQVVFGGMAASTAIALLLFCGAVGKSGQVPLHVWLPDAMEGPTPVSALIHAATMVAAGVFLVARVYPIMAAVPAKPAHELVAEGTRSAALAGAQAARAAADSVIPEAQKAAAGPQPAKSPGPDATNRGPISASASASASIVAAATTARAPGRHAMVSTALRVVTWVGAITAVFAALIALGQTDIKRILAYSTVSQLGFMFIGLGAGGVAVGMFHLLTHAFFKALLFLGSGSVIHGCHEEQDIRRMGGLGKLMPVTFATYAVGMMALAGVPLVFSGFWSKDEILHAAWHWTPGRGPFVLAAFGAFLTAFYMTRQMIYVFFGTNRAAAPGAAGGMSGDAMEPQPAEATAAGEHQQEHEVAQAHPHESPAVMTVPLAVLAVFAVVLGAFGTPVFPWFQSYLSGEVTHVETTVDVGALLTMLFSTVIVATGLGLGWRVYGRRPLVDPAAPDPLEELNPAWYDVLRRKFLIDELYEISVIRWNAWCGRAARWLDDTVWEGAVSAASYLVLGLSWASRLMDEYVVDNGFDRGCGGVKFTALIMSLWQNGQVQRYLRVLALSLALGAILFIWGCAR